MFKNKSSCLFFFLFFVDIFLANASGIDPNDIIKKATEESEKKNNNNTEIIKYTDLTDGLVELYIDTFETTLIFFKRVLVIYYKDEDSLSIESQHNFNFTEFKEISKYILENDPSIYTVRVKLTDEIKNSILFPKDLENSNIALVYYDYGLQYVINLNEKINLDLIKRITIDNTLNVIRDNLDLVYLLQKNDTSIDVIYYHSNGEKLDKLLLIKNISKDNDLIAQNVKFYIAFKETCNEIGLEPGQVHLHYNHDSIGINLRNEYTYEYLKKIILAHLFKLYNNQEKYDKIVSGRKSVLLFRHEEAKDRSQAEYIFRLVVQNFTKSDIGEKEINVEFAIAGYVDELDYSIADFVRLKDGVTKIIALDTSGDDENSWKYYHLEETISEDSLYNFINDFNNNKLEEKIISEEIPNNNNLPIKVVVGKTFQSIVIDSEEDVLLIFTQLNCEPCFKIKDILLHLHSELNEYIIFGEILSNYNRILQHDPNSFPTIYFFKNGEKNKPFLFKEDKTYENLLLFIQTHSSKKLGLKSIKEENEDILSKLDRLEDEKAKKQKEIQDKIDYLQMKKDDTLSLEIDIDSHIEKKDEI